MLLSSMSRGSWTEPDQLVIIVVCYILCFVSWDICFVRTVSNALVHFTDKNYVVGPDGLGIINELPTG